MNKDTILKNGLDTLQIEIDALTYTKGKLTLSFAESVMMLYQCKGRVVVTGMGKSGQIGKKIAATLASTGTPAFFLHPAEGVHGDLGMIVKDDVVIAISNSGETAEIKTVLPLIKRLGVGLIAIVGNTKSTLAMMSDHILDASVLKEACPLNLAPTASTTVSLALGDALAVALVDAHGFKAEDFALLHPSGSLGKRLLIKVTDVLHTADELPKVKLTATIDEAIEVINQKRFGCTAVIDDNNNLLGVITDGDLRRAITKKILYTSKDVRDIMTSSPKHIMKNELAASALKIMENYKISTLFVLDENKKLYGLIHIQDLLKVGLL